MRAGRLIWFPMRPTDLHRRLRLTSFATAGLTSLSSVSGSSVGWDDRLFEGREPDDWLHEGSHDVDDATLEEDVLGNEGGVWKKGTTLYVG
jgi:hypothetical protein